MIQTKVCYSWGLKISLGNIKQLNIFRRPLYKNIFCLYIMVQKEKSQNSNCETRQNKTNNVVSRTLSIYGPTHVPREFEMLF